MLKEAEQKLGFETYEISQYHPSYDQDVTNLCKAFSDESLFEYGLEVAQDRLDRMIEICKDASFFLLYEGKPVGVIAGMFVNNLTNGKLALQEVIWYVYKEHRSQGMMLMKHFEMLAVAKGAAHVIMALMMNSKAEKLGRIYERLGYKPFEVQYLKEL